MNQNNSTDSKKKTIIAASDNKLFSKELIKNDKHS